MTDAHAHCSDDGIMDGEVMRSGRWSTAEDLYAFQLIKLFHSGSGAAGAYEGQSLRSFLAQKLLCNPMRVSKKFASSDCKLSSRFKKSFKSESTSSEYVDQLSLEELRINFCIKDVLMESNRLKRKKCFTSCKESKQKSAKRITIDHQSSSSAPSYHPISNSSVSSNNEVSYVSSPPSTPDNDLKEFMFDLFHCPIISDDE
mmetsp:Transcript_32017/g.32647  ORF Transcript_32017/g.32647 Transcript_32017/m.32647 type:complete len:201 (-) Transcript_32017:330-932(-)